MPGTPEERPARGSFDFALRTRIVFGADTVDRIGALARELGAQQVFLVTDPGIVRQGHVDRAERALVASGIDVRRFDAVRENPTTEDVDACARALGDWDADVLCGIGGGSAIDVAKGCAFVRAGGGTMEDYWGVRKARGRLLPMIAVPTTAGTGTEVQSFALIEQEGTHQKMACGDPQAAPRIALLDPTLTVTQPRHVTACTGLDALGHAVETAVTRSRNAVSTLFSTEAFARLQANLPRVLREPDDLDARGAMLIGSAWAGIAIENSMLGAAHSMANPLTARHGMAHGLAVGTVLPTVVRFNARVPAAAALYARLARGTGLCAADATDGVAVEALVARLRALLEIAGVAPSLRTHGVSSEGIPALAAEAVQQWTARFNPRPVDEAAFVALFETASEEPAADSD